MGKKVYFIAIKNISTRTNRDNIKNGIPSCTHTKRMFKDKKPSTTIQAKLTDLTTYQELLKDGYRAGYQVHPTSEWNFQNATKPTQCLNCYEFGHTGAKCTILDLKLCSICSSTSHRHDTCPNKDTQDNIRCSNCTGNHTSLSKECQAYKDALASFKTHTTYANDAKPRQNLPKSTNASRPSTPAPTPLTYSNEPPNQIQNQLINILTNLIDLLDYI